MVRDRVSSVSPWVPTAALYAIVLLSVLAGAIPDWVGFVALGTWLVFLALERDQALAKLILISVLGIAPAVHLAALPVGASFAAQCWACALLGTALVAIVTRVHDRGQGEDQS